MPASNTLGEAVGPQSRLPAIEKHENQPVELWDCAHFIDESMAA
jgi:hypothetical protein